MQALILKSGKLLTWQGGSAPLYVIDGFVRDATDSQILILRDIDNISILKDAASAAIYGIRGWERRYAQLQQSMVWQKKLQ